MSDTWVIYIIGLNTLIYVIVFFVQKAQIDSIKSINEANKSTIETMKSLVELMDVDRFRKYSQMLEETAKMEIKIMLSDEGKFDERVKKHVADSLDEIKDFYLEKTSEKFNEYFNFTLYCLNQIEEHERELFIKSKFPLNSEILIKVLSESHVSENNTF